MSLDHYAMVHGDLGTIPGPFRIMDQACVQCPLTIVAWSMVVLVHPLPVAGHGP
jgi:hypothetical protein